MQYRVRVCVGPSSNTWPSWASHALHSASTRCAPRLLSASVRICSGLIGAQKLGHPVPESNLVSESKRSFPEQSRRYIPSSLQSWYWPENGLSVPLRLHTQNCSGVSSCFHSSSDFDTFFTMRHTSNGLRDRRLWKAHRGDGARPWHRRTVAV